jgi:outer membrane lipoprotein-sorting protein
MIFQPNDNEGKKAEIYLATDSHNRVIGVDRDADPTLDRALAALRGQAVPEGPPSRLMDDTLAAIYLAMPKAGAPSRGWFRFPARALARAAIFLIVAGAVFAALFVNLNSSSVAFADVIKKVRQSRSLTFTAHTTMPGMKQPVAMKFFATEDGRFRMEAGDLSILIFDPAAKKGLMLMPKQKQAILLDNPNELTGQKGNGDFIKAIDSFKKLGDRPQRELGEKKIDGRTLRGFVATHENLEYTFWADPKTGEPIRIEVEPLAGIVPDGSAAGMLKIAMTDFRLDPVIDPAKFSLDVPDGYSQMSIQLPRVPGGEESLLTVLRGYTRRSGGKFPASLTDWAAYGKVLKADAMKAAVAGVRPAPGALAGVSGEAMEYMANISAIIPFLTGLPKDGFDYRGNGRTLEDADQIVFWYRRADGTHRAIFGDLTVRDVNPQDVRK